ncbi:MAG: hypothetical protein ACXW4C_04295 [Nitrospira sp.]
MAGGADESHSFILNVDPTIIVTIQREAQHPSPSGEGEFFQQFAVFSDTLNSYQLSFNQMLSVCELNSISSVTYLTAIAH